VHNLAVFRYPSEYVLFNDGERLGLTMRVDSIYVRETLQGKGIGPRSVMLSLREAKALNFGFVSLEAAGSATNRSMFFGYHVWPSMGFDAILPTEKKRLLPAGLAHAERLSDLMLTEEGVEWWYARGGPIELDFDLADDSISWQLCRRYAEMKGIRI
jgi:GNAT superfamily N-acetyltransferase